MPMYKDILSTKQLYALLRSNTALEPWFGESSLCMIEDISLDIGSMLLPLVTQFAKRDKLEQDVQGRLKDNVI